MSLIKTSIRNSVLGNLFMLMVFIVGLWAMIDIPKEEFPPVDFGSFVIFVGYTGVSSKDMETEIINKIEEEISDVNGIDYIRSTAKEGQAIIRIVFEPNADIDQAWDDINAEMDKINDLPEDASDPIIVKINMREVNPICNLVIGGEFSNNSIREIAEDIKDQILNIKYISKIDIHGIAEREILIRADQEKLAANNLTLNDLNNAIAQKNYNLPAGTVKLGSADFLVRTLGKFSSISEIKNLPVVIDKNGSYLKISDFASINDTTKTQTIYSRLNGVNSVNLYVYKKDAGNIISVMENIRKFAKNYQDDFGDDISISIKNDGSLKVRKSVDALTSNAILGIVLVFVTLFIFLGWKNAFFAAIGIPFSYLLTIIIMHYFGISINTMTLFALILVTGMIVDDAIVVIENSHRYIELGLSPKEAAFKGTKEVMFPVISAVLTTAVAFLPMLIMEGIMGKFMRYFPIVVSIALLASLIECLTILPAHLADHSKQKDKSSKNLSEKLIKKIQIFYEPILIKALKHRWLSIFALFAMFIIVGALGFKFLKFEFFPKSKPSTIVLQLKTPIGTHLTETDALVRKVEAHIDTIAQKKDIKSVVTTTGLMTNNNRWQQSSSNAELRIDLVDLDEMRYTHNEIKNAIRKYLEKEPSFISYRFTEVTNGPPTGEDIELRISGDNLEQLNEAANYAILKIKEIEGTTDIESSYETGKKELQIIPRDNMLKIHKLTVKQIASYIRTAINGVAFSKYSDPNTEEVDIRVKLEDEDIKNLDDVANLLIRSGNGEIIKLKDLCYFKEKPGLSNIEHRNQKRMLKVTGSCTTYRKGGKKFKRRPAEVQTLLFGNKFQKTKGSLSDFKSKFPGYSIESGGIEEKKNESYNSLYRAFGIAILLIFTILAAQFKSYVQPLIVMLTIPFAFTGVIIGLLSTNTPFSLNSLVATVSLAGIVVNDSLILVDFVNSQREKGIDRWSSLINAGSLRLRPVLLTTITTIFGLLPMIFSTTDSASEWKPMAVSIAFGLGFATILTLLIIPVVYSFVDSFFGMLGITRFESHETLAEVLKARSEK